MYLTYFKLDAPDAEPELYLPSRHATDGLFDCSVLVRTRNDPSLLAPRFRKLAAGLGRVRLPGTVMTLERSLADAIAPRRLTLALFAAFSASALVLAVIGVYGARSYSVEQRRREIGIRMALGARRADVLRMVAKQGMRVTLLGIAGGVAGALALTRFMESLLFEVRSDDPWTFLVVTLGLAATGLLAGSGPALRAARVDPIHTLRAE